MTEIDRVQAFIDGELSRLEAYELQMGVLGKKMERTRKKLSDLCESLGKLAGDNK